MTPTLPNRGSAVDVAHIHDLLANIDAATGCGLWRVAVGMHAGQSHLKNVVGVVAVCHVQPPCRVVESIVASAPIIETYRFQNIIEQNKSACQHYLPQF